MTKSILQQYSNESSNSDWNSTLNKKPQSTHFNAIFSDDEDDQPPPSHWLSFTPDLSYHIHQADNALLAMKQVMNDTEEWKKVLKHKNGVMVYMKNGLHQGDKTPIFRGEAVIHGFSPQTIFYVVGMRKLWDEQYEDGHLVENLNDTTSLTYEVMKPTTTSKSRDLALVEKIECTQNGSIIFACTSVETPKIPRKDGKTRVNIKLLGWVLEPIYGSSMPITKVTFVIQENMRGWVSGLSKKSLAKRLLIISKVAEYLEKKAERISQKQAQKFDSLSSHNSRKRRPSIMTLSSVDPKQSILVSPITKKSNSNKRISFADQEIKITPQPQPLPSKFNTSLHLYPSHRHPIQKTQSIRLLKKLTNSLDNWSPIKSLDNTNTKYYILSKSLQVTSGKEDRIHKMNEKRKVPFIRADNLIDGGWTAEQLCSMIHSYGSRKIWDSSFEGGKIVERFSQKEYLVQWFLGSMMPITSIDIAAITTIETDPTTGVVYTATTSVTDHQIPPDESGHRTRAYTDLYGWTFKPNLDKSGRTTSVNVSFVCNMDFRYNIPDQVLQTWINKSLQSINYLHHYLNEYGCPPYIRRVAGKVLQEDFHPMLNQYQIIFISKYQPSHTRKQSQPNILWCTDIRFHHTLFPHGLDIVIKPENKANVQVFFHQNSIKIFPIDEDMDGKQFTFTLVPLSQNHGTNSYRYNGRLFCNNNKLQPEKSQNSLIDNDAIELRTLATNNAIVDGDLSVSSTSTTATIASAPAIANILKQNNTDKKANTVSNVTITHPDISIYQNQENSQLFDEAISLNIPKGYTLIPEYQNHNIIMITEDLSFNGQQLSVIFIGMVICYYVGKLSSCSTC